MPLKCEIITQERKVFEEEVDLLIVPGADGEMTILPNHSPLVAQLDFGELVIRTGDQDEFFAVGGGVLQVNNNKVLILADSAEQAEEIDLARAEEARRRAQTIMEEGVPGDEREYAALDAQIRLANLRLKVARRHRPTRSGATRTAQFSQDD